MVAGSLLKIRLSATELADGWWKLTVFSLPTLNDCQLSETFCEVWLMSKVLPLTTPVACPEPTQPVAAGTGSTSSARALLLQVAIARPARTVQAVAEGDPRRLFFFIFPILRKSGDRNAKRPDPASMRD